MDESLSKLCEESDGKIHSGCTAVTAFLRIEDAEGNQSHFQSPSSDLDSPVSGKSLEVHENGSPAESGADSVGNTSGDDAEKNGAENKKEKKSSRSRIKQALQSLGNASRSGKLTPKSTSPVLSRKQSKQSLAEGSKIVAPPANSRRVLYSANAGDARGVLCRAGKAVRLTYDHKGSDKQEAKRITDAGGFVMSGRVNGVLAVTRSLGDSSMKEFVVGAPYTTETELCDEDEFLILACDGVRSFSSPSYDRLLTIYRSSGT